MFVWQEAVFLSFTGYFASVIGNKEAQFAYKKMNDI